MKEYFWEYEYPFTEFIKKIFPKTYKRKYSLTWNGIYDLILVQDKIYQVKLTHTTKMLEDNGTLTTDKLKNKIIQNILNNFKEGTKVSVNNGKITFELGQFIAKVEIIKKVKMPEWGIKWETVLRNIKQCLLLSYK